MIADLARVRAALGDARIVPAIVLVVGLGVLLYVAALFWFGWHDTTAILAALGPDKLLAGAALASSAYIWRFARWEHSLRYFGYALPKRKHLAIYLSGLALTATPGKSGETFRSALLHREGVRVPHSLAAFIVDRASDVLGMCLLGFAAAWLLGHRLAWAWGLAFTGLLVGSSIVAYIVSRPVDPAWGWLERCRQWGPVNGGLEILAAWAMLWKLPRVSTFSVAAAVAYGTQALVFAWFCGVAGTGIPPSACVLIFVQATLFGAASMMPAGLGAMEAALVMQMTERGVGYGVAVSLAIAIRLVTLWLGMAIGALSLLAISRQQRTV